MKGKGSQALPVPDHRERESRRLHAVRLQMVETHPFWGYLLLQVRLVQAADLPTFAATDCVRHIWYNPDLTQHLDAAQLGFVLAHEVGHQLLASHSRRQGRQLDRWNRATDYAINRLVDRIVSPGQPWRPIYRTPNGTYPGMGKVEILLDRRFDGKVAETIYEILRLEEAVRASTQTSIALAVWRRDGNPGTLRLPNLPDHQGGVDVHLPEHDVTSADLDELGGRIHAAVAAWERQDQRGDCPADLIREIQARTRPALPWNRLLHRFAGQAMQKDDWTLARPDRRFLEMGILVPGPYSEKAGHLVVSVDSSASISLECLGAVGAELGAIAQQAEAVTLIVSDAAVQQVVHPQEIGSFLKRMRFRGGGGTDHRCVFQWLREHRFQPDLFIGLTDLFTTFPSARPPYPVLWVVPPLHGTAPWGHLVPMPAQ